MMPLTMASPGEEAVILKITGRDDARQHLAELGLVAGAAVSVASKMAGSVILPAKGSRAALDKSMANRTEKRA